MKLISKESTKHKKCACCREKLAQSRKVAEQRIQARKAWAREMFANYGYEEVMKRILAEQIQQILIVKSQCKPGLRNSVFGLRCSIGTL